MALGECECVCVSVLASVHTFGVCAALISFHEQSSVERNSFRTHALTRTHLDELGVCVCMRVYVRSKRN